MVTLVPEHVLKQENRVVVMKIHSATRLHPALYRVPHRYGAVVEHLRDPAAVTLDRPLLLGHCSGEFRSVFEDQYQAYIVNVGEQLRDGWAALDRPDIQSAVRELVQQVDQNGIVAVPRVQ